MGFLNYSRLTVNCTVMKVNTIHDMNKDGNLERMPMHGLDFIVNLEGVLFFAKSMWDNMTSLGRFDMANRHWESC
jgi:hypothetical protein